jgi:hypothetical protein
MDASDEPRNQGAPQTVTPAELVRRRRNRNLAMLVALVAFVVIIYVLSFVKMGGG